MTFVPDPGVLTNLVVGQCVDHLVGDLGMSIVVPMGLSGIVPNGEFPASIQQQTLTDDELELMLEFASTLTTRESSCAALAVTRNLVFCTDDFVSDGVVKSKSLNTEIWSFPYLMRKWHSTAPPHIFSSCVELLHSVAGYRCECSSEDGKWWRGLLTPRAQAQQ